MTKCGKCKHYVVKDTKINFEMSGCGTYTQYIMGCELSEKCECDFEAKVSPIEEKARVNSLTAGFAEQGITQGII